MRCQSCSTENAAGRRFCAQCGGPLSAGCPSCGAANEPSARFCGQCGVPLVGETGLTSAAAAEVPITTERRIVSVLFADLVGFTTIAEGRDAEEVRELQDRYFATARAVIERYGGTLEKFIGDAVMAVWGAPTTHEDDAERAVRAALDLVDAVGALEVRPGGPTLEARAAVMTGEAAVSLGATDQGLVTGDLVNTASRLQSVAPPGAVLIDEPTHRTTEAGIAAEPIGEQDLRGRAMPVPAWRARHTLAMVRGRGRADRLEPPFVGRDAELRLLKDLLHAANDERRARLVSVTGIAGIGKSRLAWELLKYIDGIAGDVYWHQGRSPAYGEGVTFWALAEMVRGRAGIAESDDRATARQKLDAALVEYVSESTERATLRGPLGALLGLEETPDGGSPATFAAWRRLFERIAERGLVVLVFEDLQWADGGLVDFIESILEWSRNHRILVVTLARPELLDRRPTWGAGQRVFTALHLEPLSDEAMAELLTGVAPGLPRAFARRVIERATGIPLFAVETVRMLMDAGQLVADGDGFRLEGEVGKLAVPESLRGLIGARIDGLSAADRSLLQDASVLGLTFTVEALAALTGETEEALEPRLRGLIKREIVALDADPLSPERGQFMFVQGLMREVAYETLAKKDRRARHLAAARHFETLDSEELAGILASHYLDAYLATPAGPESDALAAQARIALRAAADRSLALGSAELALGYFDRMLTVTTEPAERALIWESASSAANIAARFEAAERYGLLARDWYLATGDPLGVARAAVLITTPYFETGRTSEAIAVLESALDARAGMDEAPEVVALVGALARAFMQIDDPRALETAERSLVVAERLPVASIVADALVTKASVLDLAGHRLEGIALMRGAIELAVAERLVGTELRARSNLVVQLRTDDPRAATDVAIEVRELARRLGLRNDFMWTTWFCYSGGLLLGNWDWLEELTAEIEASDPGPLDLYGVLGTRATLAAYRGQSTEADVLIVSADAVAPPATRPGFVASRIALRAEIAALAGDPRQASEDGLTAARMESSITTAGPAVRWALWSEDVGRAREAMSILRETPERGRYVAALRSSLGAGLAALEGRRADAVTDFRAAAAIFRELDLPLDLGLSQLEYAARVGPDDAGARAAAEEARAIFDLLGAGALRERLDRVMPEGISPDRTRSVVRSEDEAAETLVDG